eukprot:5236942-Pyramimonas_sp.AAC.1
MSGAGDMQARRSTRARPPVDSRARSIGPRESGVKTVLPRSNRGPDSRSHSSKVRSRRAASPALQTRPTARSSAHFGARCSVWHGSL